MSASPLTLSTLRVLLGPAGRALIVRLAADDLREERALSLLSALRRDWPADVAGAALILARTRQRAAEKFPGWPDLWFTPEALEQASGAIVAGWRARRFAAHGAARIADLGCGAGGDTLALAALPGTDVLALDRDPLRLRLARANLDACGLAARLVQADLRAPLPLSGVRAAFFDPARRSEGRRLFSVEDYVPPLALLHTWGFETWAAKLAPGVALDELRDFTAAGAGVEFVSLGGELKEAVLWGGTFGFAGRAAVRLAADREPAVLLPAGIDPPPLSAPRAVLFEPDPAALRAGLLGELVQQAGQPLYRLDPQIAYLTGDTPVESPWLRAWPVLAWLPFNLKRLREVLRARGIGRVTVKKRGSPIAPEELIRLLKLGGEGAAAVIVLTQIAGQHSAIVCGEMLGG